MIPSFIPTASWELPSTDAPVPPSLVLECEPEPLEVGRIYQVHETATGRRRTLLGYYPRGEDEVVALRAALETLSETLPSKPLVRIEYQKRKWGSLSTYERHEAAAGRAAAWIIGIGLGFPLLLLAIGLSVMS